MLKIVKTFFNTFVDWSRVLNKPSTFVPSSHGSSAHSETYLTTESDPVATGALNTHKSSSDHDGRYYTEDEADILLGDKVDKVTGKGLSTNDYTTAEQTKVGYISVTGAINLDTIGGYLDQAVKTTSNPSFAGLSASTGAGCLKLDTINGRIGIGTTNPNYPVHFMFPATKINTTIFEGYGDNGAALGFKAFVGRGTSTSPTALQQYDNIMAFQGLAHNGGSGSTNFSQGADMLFMIESAPVANATYYRGSVNFKVSDGTNASANRLQINGNGGVYTSGFAAVTNNISTWTVVSYLKGIAGQTGDYLQIKDSSNAVLTKISATGLIFPVQAATASAPAYVKGGIYFDTTLNKLRIGGATAWETITSA